MEYPVITFTARKQSELYGSSVVIACYEVSEIVHLELPVWAKPFEVVDIFEIGSKIDDPQDIKDTTVRHPHSKWIDIPKDSINLDPGYHKYRVRLSNDEIVVTLYFDYTMQCCHPDKPYNYMDKLGKECACNG